MQSTEERRQSIQEAEDESREDSGRESGTRRRRAGGGLMRQDEAMSILAEHGPGTSAEMMERAGRLDGLDAYRRRLFVNGLTKALRRLERKGWVESAKTGFRDHDPLRFSLVQPEMAPIAEVRE